MGDRIEEDEFNRSVLRNGGASKRLKLHTKPFDDWNVVDRASVPRKLRSAMTKRNRESISPPLPSAKVIHYKSNVDGIEPPQNNGAKRNKRNTNQESVLVLERAPKQVTFCSITKDEEEVVETLYALAKMFPQDKPIENRLHGETSEAKSSPILETAESYMFISRGLKEKNVKSQGPPTDAYASSNAKQAPVETITEDPFINPTVQEQPRVCNNQKLNLSLDISIDQPDSRRTSLLFKSEDGMPAINAAKLGTSSEMLLGLGSTQTIQREVPFNEQKEQNGLWPVDSTTRKQDWRTPVKDSMERVFTSVAPSWVNSSTHVTRPDSTGNDGSTAKVQLVTVDRKKSWKKCASHVYISHLIQTFRRMMEKSTCLVLPNQVEPNDGTKFSTIEANDLAGLRTSQNEVILAGLKHDLNGDFSVRNQNCSSIRKNPDELLIGTAKEHGPQRHQHQAIATQNTSCEFLSLAVGSGDFESSTPTVNSYQGGNHSLGQFQVPYLHPVRHQLMPFSLPRSWTSSSHSDQLKAVSVQQFQLSHYQGHPVSSHQANPTNQQSQRHQQQQQQMWLAQLTSQYRPPGVSMSQFPMWHNG